MKYVIFFYFFICGNTSYAQNAEFLSEMKQIASVLKSERQYIKVQTQIFDSRFDMSKSLENIEMECFIWYPYSVIKQDGFKYYHNKTMRVSVYDDKKLVVLNGVDKSYDKLLTKLAFEPDSLMKFYSKIDQIQSKNKSHRIYRVYYKPNYVDHKYVDITYEYTTKRLLSVVIQYDKSMNDLAPELEYNESTQKIIPRVVVSYTNHRKLTQQDWSIFEAKDVVIQKSSGKYQLTTRYGHYELINYLKYTQ